MIYLDTSVALAHLLAEDRLSLSAHKSKACSLPVAMSVYLGQRDASELRSGAQASEPTFFFGSRPFRINAANSAKLGLALSTRKLGD